MKITIFAATGGIGRRAVEQAVAAGHVVTAVVRNPKKLSGRLRIVTTDLGARTPRRSSPRSKEPTPCSPALVHGRFPRWASPQRARGPSSRR
jgi:nucleoside-diphosphate-sugar epimerase